MGKERVFFVGIIENKKEKTIRYIEKILLKEEWEVAHVNKDANILGLSREKTLIFFITVQPENLKLYYSLNIKFDIILYNSKSILNYRFLQCDYFVLNSDEDSWTKLPLDKLRPLVISYGFNNRASVTVSSYNDTGDLSVNIYLQREIRTILKEDLDPFELTINLKKDPEKEDRSEKTIYKILAAVSISLIFEGKKPHINIEI